MKKGLLLLVGVALLATGAAQAAGPKGDPFQGKLFPPNVILEHREQLGLSKQQFTDIRRAVVEVQANVAEYEWDVAEAYQQLMAELDSAPIDEAAVLEYVSAALKAENEVKKLQVGMLVRLRNLLTEEQIAYLESIRD